MGILKKMKTIYLLKLIILIILISSCKKEIKNDSLWKK